MKNLTIIILLLTINLAKAQETIITKTTDNRFIGKVEVDCTQDDAGMIEDFTLGLEWWTLMGEPLEIYKTKWTSTGHFKLANSNKSISRYELSKYPDLIKRFDNLQPSKIDIKISGDIKTTSNTKYSEINNFSYIVKNHKILLCKSQKQCDDIVTGSPQNWNKFLIWRTYANEDVETGIVNITNENKYNNLTQNKKNELEKQLKYLFFSAQKIKLFAHLENIEWPEYEMNAIINEYEKRERGEDPSPEEIVENAKKETDKLQPDNNNDFWSKPDAPIELKEGTFTDSRDGHTYKWVRIGEQIWMAENLNYNAGSGSWCYDNSYSNCETYGRLYNWETALNVCPSGWHLPTYNEWQTLIDHVSGDNNAGTALKSKSRWEDGGNGNNSSGFNALPSGDRNYDAGTFYDLGYYGCWWSSTEYSSTNAYYRYLNYYNTGAPRYGDDKSRGFSVRCVRD